MTFTFERRLSTFKELKWPYASNKKYKSQPEDFAQAGFYFRPMAGSDDTVSCFLCFKSLDGWQPDDCAWQEHQNHSSPCPLVTLNLVPSRLRTFDKWPGAKVRGGVRALAEAGFFHLPKDDGDDSCTCYQCGLSLDGWETDDDPLHEHSRRRPNCPYIVNQKYIKPASFEFILANKPDNPAICDIADMAKATDDKLVLTAPPQTPVRKNAGSFTGHSTIKSKKIRISVPQAPQSSMKSSALSSLTMNTPRVIPSTAKTPISKTKSDVRSSLKLDPSSDLKSDLIKSFPSLKSQQDKILTWTMEELFDHLIKEKVEMFQEFLNKKMDID